MKNIVSKFDSVSEMHNYLDAGTVQPYFENNEISRSEDRSWTGTDSYEHADELLLFGDAESAKKVQQAGVDKLRANIQKYVNKRSIYTSPVGFAAHVPNYLAGTPNSMIATRTTRQPKKVITVVYSDTANCSIPAGTISDTAAKVFSALIIIEARGVQVNMYTGVCSYKNLHGGCQKIGFFTRVKKAGQRFDILRMCYPCINPSWLRRHFFRFVEISRGVSSKFVHSYGQVCGQTACEELVREAKISADAVLTFDACRDLSVEQIIEKITNGGKK